MDFIEVITKRKSIRKYDLAKPVSDDLVNKVLDAARIAPSACNLQPWHFIVVRDEAVKAQFKEVYGREWLSTAPVIIVGCVDRSIAWKRKDGANYAQVDITIAFDHLILAATNYGLGTCWVGAFDNEKAKKVLKVPENLDIVAMTPLGFPAEEPGTRGRKEFREIVHNNRW